MVNREETVKRPKFEFVEIAFQWVNAECTEFFGGRSSSQ